MSVVMTSVMMAMNVNMSLHAERRRARPGSSTWPDDPVDSTKATMQATAVTVTTCAQK